MSITDKDAETNTTREIREDWNVINTYESIKKTIEIKEVTTENIMTIAMCGIPIIQRMITEPARGKYKKNVLIAVMKKLVGEFVKKPNDRAMINLIIDTTVSNAIDMLIDVARGAVDLGKGKTRNCCVIA